MKLNIQKTTYWLVLLTFFAFVIYILYVNREVLYTAHDRSEFLYGVPFFHTLMSKPFGFMQYVGAWLTMLFCRPAIGGGVLVAVWMLIFLVGTRAFRLQGGAAALMLLPVACLLTSVVDMGYWIYTSTIRGYWFSQSVGYLAMLLLVWAARSTTLLLPPGKKESLRGICRLAWYLIAFCLYPLLGWYALLFILCLILTEKPSWPELAGILILIFTAGIWHTQYYSYLKFDDVVLAGFPRFETPSDSTPRLSIPFCLLGASSVLIPLCGRYLAKAFVPVLSAAVGIAFTCSQMYYDRSCIDEMRMVRLACDDDWKGVLQLAEVYRQPTNTMVFLKNVALMNEGGLLDRSFKLGNDAASINNPDSLHVTLLDIASPLVYSNYGLMNEAIRLCFEMAIQGGFSPFYLKMLARCALAVGDEKLVERYVTLLHHLPFYGDWQPAPATAKIKEMQHCYPDALTGVENSDSYLANEVSHYDSDGKVASEQALLYSMLRCDSRRFWPSLRNYAKSHIGEEFPLHAMEAYILFIDKAPEEKRMMLPVEQTVYDRYKRFWQTMETVGKPGMTIRQVGEKMRHQFGDTYWWYNLFGRKPIHLRGTIGQEVAS